MGKRLLSILALTILVASTLVGCSGASPTPSTLTVLSITDGTVLVMKAGTDSWAEAQAGTSLEAGDSIKTGDSSGAEITFFDGSTIELEAGTQIEITSLDSSPDTGAKTITLMQTIGTTISRVTKLLDPASSYQVETPTGVAAVRGSVLVVRIVFDDPNYEDGTVLMTCVEGDIWVIWNGVQLRIPEGYTCVIRPDQLLELIPPSEPPQEETGDVTDEDTSNGQPEDQQPGGSATDNLSQPRVDIVTGPSFFETPSTEGETPPTDVETPPTDDETPPNDGGTTATIQITISPRTGSPVFIWDENRGDDGGWAMDLDTGLDVNGVEVSAHITVTANHHYYVWVGGDVYNVRNSHGWTVSPAPAEYGGEQADGSPGPGDNQPLQFEKA